MKKLYKIGRSLLRAWLVALPFSLLSGKLFNNWWLGFAFQLVVYSLLIYMTPVGNWIGSPCGTGVPEPAEDDVFDPDKERPDDEYE